MEAVCSARALGLGLHATRNSLAAECNPWRSLNTMTAAPRLRSWSASSSPPVWTRRIQRSSLSRHSSSRVRSQVAADQIEEPVTIDNSSVLVVGGGGVGMEVVRAFAKAGSWVTAYQRGEKFRKEIEELGSMLAIGDVLDVKAIEKVLRSNSFDAIVCTVGGGTTQTEVDKDGPINLVNAAKKAGVKRFLMVSSVGVGDSVKAIDEKTLAVLRTVLEAKEVAEEAIKASGISYTIIRPGGLLSAKLRALILIDGMPMYIAPHLFVAKPVIRADEASGKWWQLVAAIHDGVHGFLLTITRLEIDNFICKLLLGQPATGNWVLTEDCKVAGLISRGDVASLIMKVLFNEKAGGKTFTAIDKDKLLPPTDSLEGVELVSFD